MIIIGIDPGINGAIAIYNTESGGLGVYDMPCVAVKRNGKDKREVSAAGVALVLSASADKERYAFIERVNAMPKQGVSSVFSFGRSAGIVEGVVAALLIPGRLVTPQAWQKATGCREGKDGARLRAQQTYPVYAKLFDLKKHDGRADAAMLCVYGLGVIGSGRSFADAPVKREGSMVVYD